VAPCGRFLEVKPNKRDRLVRRVMLKTKSAVLEHPIDKIVLLGAPRLNDSSYALLILVFSIDCEQPLFCSEIRGEKCNEESKTNLTANQGLKNI